MHVPQRLVFKIHYCVMTDDSRALPPPEQHKMLRELHKMLREQDNSLEIVIH